MKVRGTTRKWTSPHITVTDGRKKEEEKISPGLVSWFRNRQERFLQAVKAPFSFRWNPHWPHTINSLLLINQAKTNSSLVPEDCVAFKAQHCLVAHLLIKQALTPYTESLQCQLHLQHLSAFLKGWLKHKSAYTQLYLMFRAVFLLVTLKMKSRVCRARMYNQSYSSYPLSGKSFFFFSCYSRKPVFAVTGICPCFLQSVQSFHYHSVYLTPGEFVSVIHWSINFKLTIRNRQKKTIYLYLK